MHNLWLAYKMRLKRRRLLFRALRKRRQLTPITDHTDQITEEAVLAFSTVRNEIIRLPYFLEYYRSKGIQHFLMVDNNSEDGTAEYLAGQPDVSLWHTGHSYKKSRFGVDWLTWLQIKYGHGHWCLTVDADEILVFPHCDTRPLRALTEWLDTQSIPSLGALMLDMYPKGALGAITYQAGDDPFDILCWFDAEDYLVKAKDRSYYLSVQGGVRERMFFKDNPERAPHLNKIPLVKWNRRYTYVSSTHALLPPQLNQVFDISAHEKTTEKTTGILLHSKFLHTIVEKSYEEMHRQEHFTYSDLYDEYYESLIESPDLWCEASCKYEGWQQLEALGLLSKGDWE